MICPKCHEPMFVAEYDGIELDHCALCAGTWFDHDELGLLFADAAGNVPDALTSETIAALPDAEGRASRRIEGLPPGVYRVAARRDRHRVVSEPFEVRGGDTTVVEIALD